MRYSTLFILAAASLVAASPAPIPVPLPTGIPSESTAVKELKQLVVAPQGSSDGYSRSKFPHWISQGGGCDTRDVVLERDGTDIEVGDGCDVSGKWLSPYDGGTWTD